MGAFLYYILRTSIATAILYLFFKLLLSRNRLHKMNRFVILFFFSCSLILPFFSLNISGFFPQKTENTLNLQNINIVENVPIQNMQAKILIPWETIFTAIYIAGTILLLIFFSISLLRMFHIIRTSEKNNLNERIKLCISKKDISPFSWMNHLVLSNKDYSDESNSIIQHEMAHISYHHSLDMMIANIYIVIFWFNPFAWLLRKELQTIHEYQADEKVISAGADMKEYQLLLIRKCVGENKFMLANNFEYSNLQKRIKMIMNTKTKKTKKWIYALTPLLFIAISATLSAENLHSKIETSKESFDLLNNDSIKKIMKVIIKDDTTFVTETTNGIEKTSKIIGEPDYIKGKRVITIDDEDKDGKKITKKIVILTTDTINSVKPLFILDGKEITKNEFDNISPEDIESVNVYKDKKAAEMCGEKGKNGVILITTKNKAKNADKATYIVDGVYSDKNVADEIDPSDIVTVNIYKGNDAIKLYGDKGKDGVITIITKKQNTNVNDSPVKEEVMNYIEKQKNKKLKSSTITSEGNRVITKGISDKNTAVFIDGQLADVKTLQKMDHSKIKVINTDPISNFPELAIKYNLHKERIVQVFTK